MPNHSKAKTMKRNKRSQHQLQQIVKMKVAVLQQQKEDIIDTLNDFVSYILTEVEKILAGEEGGASSAQYQKTLIQLDRVSQLFTNLASHIDSTLYADDDKVEEKHLGDASGDGKDVPQAASDKLSEDPKLEKTIQQNQESDDHDQRLKNHSSRPYVKEDQEVVENAKPVSKQTDTSQLHQEGSKEKFPEKLTQKETQIAHSPQCTEHNFSSVCQSAPGLGDGLSDSTKSELNLDHLELDSNASDIITPSCDREIISGHADSKKRTKKMKSKTGELPSNSSASLDVTTHSESQTVSQAQAESLESKVTSKEETESNSVTHEPPIQNDEDATQQIRDEYNGTPLFLPSMLHTPQPSFPPPHQGHPSQPWGGELHNSFALPPPLTLAQPTFQPFERRNFPIPGVHGTLPLMNSMNPRIGAPAVNFLPSNFSRGANFYLGQNPYHPLPLLNAGQTFPFPHAGHQYNNMNNPAHLAQLMSLSTANPGYISQLNSLSAGHILPPRQGVLVQTPLITTAPPSPDISTQIMEVEGSRNRSSSCDTSGLPNSTTPSSNCDQEVAGFVHCRNVDSPQLSDPLPQGGKRDTPPSRISNESPSVHNVTHNRPMAAEDESQESITENLGSRSAHVEENQQSNHSRSPPASPSCRFSLQFKSNRSQSFHNRMSRKMRDIPEDLKDIIKNAMQENKVKKSHETEKPSCQDNNPASSLDSDTSKDMIGEIRSHSTTPVPSKQQKQPDSKDPQLAQLQLRKDEIVVVSISNVESPWSFHAQMPDQLPHISQGIREAVGNTELGNAVPKSGLFCLAKFIDGKYYRAQVQQHIDMGDYPPRLQVSYVDYGNKHWVSASDLLQLPGNLTKFPAQSVLCTLAKVTPSTDNWTEKATELMKKLTQTGNVQMRIVHPKSKRRRNLSGSPCGSPPSPEAEPKLSSPNTPPSTIEVPYLVDIIARQYKGTEAVSVSSVLVKAGHAKAISIESQLDSLVKLKVQYVDRRFLGLQQMMSDLTAPHNSRKHKSQAAGDTSTLVAFQGSSAKLRPKKIPSCLQMMKLKSQRSDFFLSKLAKGESQERPNNMPPKTDSASSNHSVSAEHTEDSESFTSFNEPSLSLCVEVDEKLRNLGQAKERLTKSQKDKELLESRNELDNSDFHCLGQSEGEDEVEYKVVLTSVISPSSFFVQPVDGHNNMAWLVEGLNKKYGSFSNQILVIMSNAFTPEENSICCAVFSEDGFYYRGRILDIKPDMVLILFIDFGDFEWVPRKKVYPLTEEFKTLPSLALWCSLKGVMPLDVTDSESQLHRWPLQAIKTFKSLVMKSSLFEIVASKSDQQRVKGQSFQLEPLQVFLVDHSGASEGSSETESGADQPEDELCLNYELIHLGLAVVQPSSINYSEASTQELESEPDLAEWDPLQEDFESYRNSYKVNTDDPGVALLGYEAGKPGAGGQKVCVFYNRRRGCFKGDTCPDLHTKAMPGGSGLQHDLGSVHVFDEDQSGLLPREGTLVIVTVSTVVTPSKFYVTLPWGQLTYEEVANNSQAWHRHQAQESLEGLMENMQKFYAQSPFDRDLTVLGFCEAIAARVEGRWVRAKVIDSNEDKGLIQVVSVDFGWEVWVKETELRDLELRFLHLPPQAVACSLAVVAPSIHHSSKWVSDACKCFADLVLDKPLVAFVKHRDPSGRLSLELYDTSGPEDVNINQTLVDMGWARPLSNAQTSSSPDQGVSALSLRRNITINLAPA